MTTWRLRNCSFPLLFALQVCLTVTSPPVLQVTHPALRMRLKWRHFEKLRQKERVKHCSHGTSLPLFSCRGPSCLYFRAIREDPDFSIMDGAALGRGGVYLWRLEVNRQQLASNREHSILSVWRRGFPQGCIGSPPPPLQSARSMPSRCLHDAKCQLQRHLQRTVTAPNRCGNLLRPPV